MDKYRILVIEDEEDIAELIRYNLSKDKFNVECSYTGEDGYDKVLSNGPDLVLLDLMLPGMDGLKVCELIKNSPKTRHIPVVILTAKGEEEDVVKGLEVGADDYITKPFSPKVLIARIHAVLRRAERKSQEYETEEGITKFGEITIYNKKRKVISKGKEVELTFTEFQVLCLLIEKAGWVFTRSQIVDAIRGTNHAITDRSVDVHIVGLRKKLGDIGKYVETIRGVGYRMKEISPE
jgi:two-component system phosphate regulon response regulator PhoB